MLATQLAADVSYECAEAAGFESAPVTHTEAVRRPSSRTSFRMAAIDAAWSTARSSIIYGLFASVHTRRPGPRYASKV